MKKVSFLTIAFIITLMAGTASALTADLVAGQNTVIGTVTVWHVGSTLFVEYYTTTSDWVMTQTHMHIATSLTEIPQKNGNPKPGKFDYKTKHNPSVTKYLYIIPGGWSDGSELYIAAHAVVQKVVIVDGTVVILEETAWGDGTCDPEDPYEFPGNNWATYLYYYGQ